MPLPFWCLAWEQQTLQAPFWTSQLPLLGVLQKGPCLPPACQSVPAGNQALLTRLTCVLSLECFYCHCAAHAMIYYNTSRTYEARLCTYTRTGSIHQHCEAHNILLRDVSFTDHLLDSNSLQTLPLCQNHWQGRGQ